MVTNADNRIGVEAREEVTHRTGGISRHEIALHQYLLAAQYQMDAGGSGAGGSGPTTTGGASGQVGSSPSEATTDENQAKGHVLSHEGAIVVGLDSSPAARAAADWAAADAHLRHAELRLVHAFVLPAMAGYPDYNAIPDDLRSVLRDEGQALLNEVSEDLRARYPGLTISTGLIYDRAVVALREESVHAHLTVVGATGVSRLSGVLLGSVALALASTNPAPVAVVHPSEQGGVTGPVVVGVDGSPTSEAAVAFAFDEAALRHTDLVAVHAWSDLVVEGSHRLQPILVDPAILEQEEKALLGQRLAGWREKYPDVAVRQVVVPRRPTPALLDEARNAQLLVVGSHGRGGFVGMLLGSTSHALIGHSACPVVVVRPPRS